MSTKTASLTAKSVTIEVANGVRYTYRRFAEAAGGVVLLVSFTHFHCSMDSWGLHLVMGPESARNSRAISRVIDGRPPRTAHGIDVDDQGNGAITERRLYRLIRQPKPIGDRLFEIKFLDSGVEAFGFTFC